MNVAQRKKLMFISTDGANVVSSTRNGLVGKLKSDVPHLLSMKCAAHKISLGVKDLSNEFLGIKILNESIYQLSSYFNTKQRLDLLKKNQYKLLQGGHHSILLLLQQTDVRWISYYPSVVRIIEFIFPIIDILKEIIEEDYSSKIFHLINYFEQLDNINYLSIYGDILEPICKLSKQVQKEYVNLATLEEDLKLYISCFNDLKEKEGSLVRKLIQRIGVCDKENEKIYFLIKTTGTQFLQITMVITFLKIKRNKQR